MSIPDSTLPSDLPKPFDNLVPPARQASALQGAISDHYRAAENSCVVRLLGIAALQPGEAEHARQTAHHLVTTMRRKGPSNGVQALLQEFSLSSQEGVALMCVAEALLRIPDVATRDALIADKLGRKHWRGHLGTSASLFVNAATWGLVVTGTLVSTYSDDGLSHALMRVVVRTSRPVLRRCIDVAMSMIGDQFVIGETISVALARSRRAESQGFRYSYDMLGDAAVTAADAERYCRDYETAIHAIGEQAQQQGVYDGPGISIKLSALHPRYCRAQQDRVHSELLPRVKHLASLAKRYDIGFNIDAEEADRLALSLDLLEQLCQDPELADWDGLGFVVQAYQKRALFVVDHVIDLARRSGHRLMVRLVKGAYWDSEIKRAQVDGLEDFPVFTRKAHTDVSYMACARKLLDATDRVFPQFATHNAQTLAAILAMQKNDFQPGDYEFQCLNGMGEPLYEEVVGASKLGRPCRIYAPVGTHETLLAYLVRRMLENGANSSFVNRIYDPAISLDEVIADPVAQVAASLPIGTSHLRIALPAEIYGPGRINSAGLDLSDDATLAAIAAQLRIDGGQYWAALPLIGAPGPAETRGRAVRNPADEYDVVGTVIEATEKDVDHALAAAEAAAKRWSTERVAQRAACLLRAADILEQRKVTLMGLLVREAGKSLSNAIAEVREAVDFMRYYAVQAEQAFEGRPVRSLGPVACISPWNFPLAIFTGQVTAALAAGNPVLAKPAEETPLIAAQMVELLHEAGIPRDVLVFLPGDGRVGAALVADHRIRGVMFTGSTDVARVIQHELAKRLNPDGAPVPFIAETGGQNALVVDSSALAEQVVADAVVSAFDSAGQRCSALRLLCLQDDVADRILTMLDGAISELTIGNPDRLATDIGPVISVEARDVISAYVAKMRSGGHTVRQAGLPDHCRRGSFVAPAVIEISSVADLKHEVFGPVLHVLRFRRHGLGPLIDAINATGYGLTFGVHSRVDETVDFLTSRSRAGNLYVNRNLIGATVGLQPFGGNGLSGTGPKAGGPFYVRRLIANSSKLDNPIPGRGGKLIVEWINWLEKIGKANIAVHARSIAENAPSDAKREFRGPVGEKNIYRLEPRGTVACLAISADDLLRQITTAFATGNRALVQYPLMSGDALPVTLRQNILETISMQYAEFDVALACGDDDSIKQTNLMLSQRSGAIVTLVTPGADNIYPMDMLVRERLVSINTTAAGGNANLMSIA